MIATTVYVCVKPEYIGEFINATIRNHEYSTKENGNLRFDVLQSTDDPARFMLYEAYESEEQAAAHKQTAHYVQWRDAVAEMMAEPRRGVPYCAIRP
jgi:autoinducer 2-degrading protein